MATRIGSKPVQTPRVAAPATSQAREVKEASSARAAEISSFAPGSGVERRYSVKFLQGIDQRLKLAGVPPELAGALSRRFASMSRSELDREGRVVDTILSSSHPKAGLEVYEFQAKLSSVVTPGGFRVAPNAEKSWTVTPPKGEAFVFGGKGEKTRTLGDGATLSAGKGGTLSVGDQVLVRSTAEQAARLGSGLGALTVSIAAGAADGGPFVVMLNDQKLTNKEARAEKKTREGSHAPARESASKLEAGVVDMTKIGGAAASGDVRKLSFGDLVQSTLPWPFHKDLPAPSATAAHAEEQQKALKDAAESLATGREDRLDKKTGSAAASGDVLMTMVEYQKLQNQEAREDRKVASAARSEAQLQKLQNVDLPPAEAKARDDERRITDTVDAALRLVSGSTKAKELGALLTRAGQSGAPSSRNDPDAERAALLIAIGSRAAKLQAPKTAAVAMKELTTLADTLRGAPRQEATASIQQSLGTSAAASSGVSGAQGSTGASVAAGLVAEAEKLIKALQAQIQNLEEQLKSKLKQREGIAERMQELRGRLAAGGDAAAINGELANLQLEDEHLVADIEGLKREVASLQEQIARIQHQLEKDLAALAAATQTGARGAQEATGAKVPVPPADGLPTDD